jgi:ribonuclease-3
MAVSMARLQKLHQLEKKLGVKFKNLELLDQALCHKSYVHEHPGENLLDNERLEFFGDAVLKLVISEYLFNNYPEHHEGYLTKARALIVSDQTLFKVSLENDLPDFLLLSKNEKHNEGGRRKSIAANLVEAIFGACYLDGGIDIARKVVIDLLGGEIKSAIETCQLRDYKSLLQEKVQAMGWNLPEYKVVKEEGPEHEKKFFVRVSIGSGLKKFRETGHGLTKKEAEQMAAKTILEKETFQKLASAG